MRRAINKIKNLICLPVKSLKESRFTCVFTQGAEE